MIVLDLKNSGIYVHFYFPLFDHFYIALYSFLQSGRYKGVASVEWEKPQANTLINRLETKWGVSDASERVMRFDMQREEELFKGWNDEKYGQGKGLDHFVTEAGRIDLIIGGPPCQTYSIAGRAKDKNGMRGDYRNYLFEHYLSVVKRYRPKLFVFENVPGLLRSSGSHLGN